MNGPVRGYPPPPLRVLVVDDEPDTRTTLRLLLGIWGHAVCEAGTFRQALAVAAIFRPDAALLDVILPDGDGLELGLALRVLPGLEKIALVALTGYSDDGKEQRAVQARFQHYLLKPADPVALRRILGHIRHGD